jgi:hypothetical protein
MVSAACCRTPMTSYGPRSPIHDPRFVRCELVLDGRPLFGRRRGQARTPEELVQFDHWQAGDLAQAGGEVRFACRAWTHDHDSLHTSLWCQSGKIVDINPGPVVTHSATASGAACPASSERTLVPRIGTSGHRTPADRDQGRREPDLASSGQESVVDTRDADAPGHLHLALNAERVRPAFRSRAIAAVRDVVVRRAHEHRCCAERGCRCVSTRR